MAMIIKTNGAMTRFAVRNGEDAIEAMQDVVDGEDIPLRLPNGSDIVFNLDGKADGLPLNLQASIIATQAMGRDPVVALHGNCILFRPGELDEFERADGAGKIAT